MAENDHRGGGGVCACVTPWSDIIRPETRAARSTASLSTSQKTRSAMVPGRIRSIVPGDEVYQRCW